MAHQTVEVATVTLQAFYTGGNSDVDATAEALTTRDVPLRKGIVVKAAAANSGIVYVGPSSSVTADSDATTGGFPLSAGDSVTIEVNNANLVYCIGSVTNQAVSWLGV